MQPGRADPATGEQERLDSYFSEHATDWADIYQRDEEFAYLYANNVRFESSAFDLKMIFGELDQSGKDGLTVIQHTARAPHQPPGPEPATHQRGGEQESDGLTRR